MKSIVVFCGSQNGFDKLYEQYGYLVGLTLAEKNIRVIYGGAKVGLMGAVARGALDKDGQVIGVIPDFLQSKEIAHDGLTELIVVSSMHERKMKMHELSDGILALPGGFGTMEELFEMLTWAQLGLHQKPIGILNIDQFYDPLLNLLNGMVLKGFLSPLNHQRLLVSDRIQPLLNLMTDYRAPEVPKWIEIDET